MYALSSAVYHAPLWSSAPTTASVLRIRPLLLLRQIQEYVGRGDLITEYRTSATLDGTRTPGQKQEESTTEAARGDKNDQVRHYRTVGNEDREDIRAQSEVRDPLLVIKKKKLGWAGHIMRRNDGRWTRLVQEWYPIGEKRPVGRPRMRWSDSLKEQISLFDGNHLKTHWSTIAKDRMAWKAVIRDHIR
uniref:Uncharacterized protein n=1 Tax=Caenorhabditis japonica TaxID=281687 RepID=A0A8R1EGJ6_CAEJA